MIQNCKLKFGNLLTRKVLTTLHIFPLVHTTVFSFHIKSARCKGCYPPRYKRHVNFYPTRLQLSINTKP